MADNGWQPLSSPGRSGTAAFVVTPFTRLARTHAAAVAGDTLIALALANSLFFDIDPNAARDKVALYLALTMAPFAVVAPLIGPALDRARGGRRLMVIGANALRAVICLLLLRDIDSLLLFPEAFAVLVLAKSYHVAKSAIVPTVVHSDDELVEANSRLSFLSGVVTFAAAVPGGLAFAIGNTFDSGSQAVLILATVVFAIGAVLGIRIPATKVVVDDTSETERQELRGGGILLAASAMGLMRGIVGFLTFLIAFALRTSDAPTFQFGLVLAASGVGSLLGALVAPALRRAGSSEERILLIVLGLTAVGGLLCAWAGGIAAAAALALCVGIAASSGKLAFDSVVQRDAPDANRGRSFARFETRFQLTWVAGAFLPVVVTIPLEIGFVVVAACAGFALFSYLAGLRSLARGQVPVRRKPTEAITSRLRRRRQGFAVSPDTPSSPSPAMADALADADADGGQSEGDDGWVDESGDDRDDRDDRDDHDPDEHDPLESTPPPPTPALFDDEAPPVHPRDRGVVIDPTQL